MKLNINYELLIYNLVERKFYIEKQDGGDNKDKNYTEDNSENDLVALDNIFSFNPL